MMFEMGTTVCCEKRKKNDYTDHSASLIRYVFSSPTILCERLLNFLLNDVNYVVVSIIMKRRFVF